MILQLLKHSIRLLHITTGQKSQAGRNVWVEVLHYKDSSGEQTFQELAPFALSLLAMPLSNLMLESYLATCFYRYRAWLEEISLLCFKNHTANKDSQQSRHIQGGRNIKRQRGVSQYVCLSFVQFAV